jgi:hypothetical protein
VQQPIAIRFFTVFLIGGALATCPGCETDRGPEQTVVDYAEAVQQRDLDRLYCLSAGASSADELGLDEAQRREAFAEWAASQYTAYELGRDEGRVDLDGHGIQLVKLLALGRGTYSTLEPARSPDAGTRLLTARLRFGYDAIDLSRYSPGTTLYFNGAPVGNVRALEIPRGYREMTLTVLESVSVEWTLVRQPAGGGCGEGWAVASVEPVRGTERTTSVHWEF